MGRRRDNDPNRNRCLSCGESDWIVQEKGWRGKPVRKCRPCMNRRSREYQKNNRARVNARRKIWIEENPKQRVKAKDRSLRWSKNSSVGEFLDLKRAQKGRCAICRRQNTTPHDKRKHKAARQLCVDHDHRTGKVRGLLCNHCNTMLGMARDSVEVLVQAARYLRSHTTSRSPSRRSTSRRPSRRPASGRDRG